MKEVKSLAFLIKEDGRTIIVTRSADRDSGNYIVCIENLFGVEARIQNRLEIKILYGVTLPHGF
jgi:hypothetical protein